MVVAVNVTEEVLAVLETYRTPPLVPAVFEVKLLDEEVKVKAPVIVLSTKIAPPFAIAVFDENTLVELIAKTRSIVVLKEIAPPLQPMTEQ